MVDSPSPVDPTKIPDDKPPPEWARPVIAMAAIIMFAGIYIGAWIDHDQNMKTLMAGAVIGFCSGVFSFYLGSSSDSSKKTGALIAANQQQQQQLR